MNKLLIIIFAFAFIFYSQEMFAQTEFSTISKKGTYISARDDSVKTKTQIFNNPTFEIKHTKVVNDQCVDAIQLYCGDTISGNTSAATFDSTAINCLTSYDTPGIWYYIVGNGDFYIIDVCSHFTFDTKILVYSGDCQNLQCVSGNDDYCGIGSRVSFQSDMNTIYYVLVTGHSGASGSFDLSLHCSLSCIFEPHVEIISDETSASLFLSQIGNFQYFEVEVTEENLPYTGTPNITATTSTINIDSLQANSFYKLRLRTICDSTYTSWSKSHYFSTFCLQEDHLSFTYQNGHLSAKMNSVFSILADDIFIDSNQCLSLVKLQVSYLSKQFDSLSLAIFSNGINNKPDTLVYYESNCMLSTIQFGTYDDMQLRKILITPSSPITLCGGQSGAKYWVSTWLHSSNTAFWILNFQNLEGSHPVGIDSSSVNIYGNTWSNRDWAIFNLSISYHFMDEETPQIECASDTTILIDGSLNGIIFNYNPPVFSDNCHAFLSQTSGLPSGSFFPIGTTINEFKVEDKWGNFSTCYFRVIVADSSQLQVNSYDNKKNLPFLYPNPNSNGIFHLQDNFETPFNIQVFSIQAQLVYEEIILFDRLPNYINLTHLQNGVYIVKMAHEDQCHYQQIIIQ
jgi:hypothetical protein